jgi:hypothetical protein
MSLCHVFEIGRYKMKGKKRIPRIAIILFIVALIGPGVQLGKYVLNNQPSIVAQSVDVDSKIHLKTVKSVSFNDPQRSLPDYQIIVKNDLFDPLGGQRSLTVAKVSLPQQMTQVEKKQAPPDPLYKLTFTGVVQLESEDSAIVEDLSKNKAYYLKKGDKLKDYTVEAITEDSITLSNGNSRFTTRIGSAFYYNTSGQISTSEPSNNQVIAKVSDSKTEETTSISSGSANQSLIEQMKARRKKELEQK